MGTAPRKRRWPLCLAVLAVALLLGAWWVNRALEPQHLAATVLASVGESQGLEISFTGTPEYALRPEPRLLLEGVVVRQPGAAAPLLTAARAEVSLPWDTVLGEGPVVITRIELQQPALDLAALDAWLSTRPDTGPAEMPTLTRGLHLTAGTVQGDGWRLQALSVDLPALAPGKAAKADVSGEFVQGDTTLLFTGPLALATAGLDSPLRFEGGGKLRSGELDARWSATLAGRMDLTGAASVLEIDALAFKGESPLPELDARGRLALGDELLLELAGQLANWPADWPPLPESFASTPMPLDYELTYGGATDFSTPLKLLVSREDTRLDSRFSLTGLLAWLENDGGNPLPPLQGTLSTPALVVEGFTLEGVEVRLSEPAEDAASEE
ncbi:hypothetical protein [Arenimonas sp.]|uniref:hypothetical protein n=1 Tax=Arenimonas sp. TaxID=1872635 RepID=UPI0035AF7828